MTAETKTVPKTEPHLFRKGKNCCEICGVTLTFMTERDRLMMNLFGRCTGRQE